MASPQLRLLAAIAAQSSGGGGDPVVVPPTSITSSATTNIGIKNSAVHNAFVTRLQLAGGLPQGTGVWSFTGTPWDKLRFTATTGTQVELRIEDPDGLALADNGTKTAALQYTGEGLVSPLTISLTITVTSPTVATGAYVFNHDLPWPLPQDDDDITFFFAPATNFYELPRGSDATWNKVLVVVAPAGGMTSAWTKTDGLKWGGVLFVGFDFKRVGQTTLMGPKKMGTSTAPIASRRGGHLFELSFAAGAAAKMIGNRRPYLWFSNCRFDIVNFADSTWGDFLRHGTAIVGNATNKADYHDFYFQNMYFDKGHLNFDSSDSAQTTNPHSDLYQSAKGGCNNIYNTRCWIVWNGLMCYTLDSGNILNAPFRTEAPNGSRFFWEDIRIQPAEDPIGLDSGTWNPHTQSRTPNAGDPDTWNVANNGNWRAFYPKGVKIWLPVGHPKRNSPQSAFRTYGYQKLGDPPAKVLVGGRTYVRWTPWGGTGRTNGDKTVMGDLQVEFVDTEAELDEVIAPSLTGKNWRLPNIAALRQAFPQQ